MSINQEATQTDPSYLLGLNEPLSDEARALIDEICGVEDPRAIDYLEQSPETGQFPHDA